jgi:hypothetical protein
MKWELPVLRDWQPYLTHMGLLVLNENCDPWLARSYACAVGVMRDRYRLRDTFAIAVEPNTI